MKTFSNGKYQNTFSSTFVNKNPVTLSILAIFRAALFINNAEPICSKGFARCRALYIDVKLNSLNIPYK